MYIILRGSTAVAAAPPLPLPHAVAERAKGG